MGYHDRYIENGYGPAVVFSHGTSMDATMFDPQLENLAGRGYRAIACNSRVLTGEPAPHTLGDLAEDCRALLDDLGIETCVLAGMSVGGLMALEFALAYPERLEGLIVIAATSLAYPAEEREQFHREFDKLDVDGMVPRAFAEWVAPYCFGATTLAHNRELVDHWIERWATTVPARAVLYQGRSWIDKEDITARLATIDVPVAGDSRRGGRADSHRSRAADGRRVARRNVRAHSEGRALGQPGGTPVREPGHRALSRTPRSDLTARAARKCEARRRSRRP